MAELAGRPISGEFSPGLPTQVEQWDEERFIELLDAIFESDSRVKAVGWRQYTPYFNDGDECVFGANVEGVAFGVPARMRWDTLLDEEDNEVESKRLYSLRPKGNYAWGEDGLRVYVYENDPKYSPDWKLYRALSAFVAGVDGGHFDNLLIENFGDHVAIIALPDEFRVEYFEHD